VSERLAVIQRSISAKDGRRASPEARAVIGFRFYAFAKGRSKLYSVFRILYSSRI
jgi:hypothetical protein